MEIKRYLECMHSSICLQSQSSIKRYFTVNAITVNVNVKYRRIASQMFIYDQVKQEKISISDILISQELTKSYMLVLWRCKQDLEKVRVEKVVESLEPKCKLKSEEILIIKRKTKGLKTAFKEFKKDRNWNIGRR